jgi:TLC domain-containing protein
VTNRAFFKQRPYINYYAPSFILYELSSPFLNIHWFCDKLDLTGSPLQMINGVLLLVSFAGCRLIYGSYISLCMWYDAYQAYTLAQSAPHSAPLALSAFALNATTSFENPFTALEVVKFASLTPNMPLWLVGVFVGSNILMHALNWHWYGKMISALRKRFDPPLGTRTKEERVKEEAEVTSGVDASGRKVQNVDAVEVLRKRIPLQRFQSSDIPPPN